MRRFYLGIATCIGLGLGLLAASETGAIGSASSHRQGTSDATSTTSSTGGPSGLVSEIEANLGSPDFTAVTVGAAPASVPAGSFQGSWMSVVPGDDSVETRWKALLLAGAYRALAPSQGLQSLGGITVVGRSDAVIENPQPNPTPSDPGTLTAKISANLAQIGLTPVSIQFVKPDAYAPIVVAKAADPAEFIRDHPNFTFDVFGDLDNWEGVYFEIDDASGNPIWQSGSSSRTGLGTSWTDPNFGNPETLGRDPSPPTT